jgi:hypothetical protein
MDPVKAGVSPNYWEKGRANNYTMTFHPIGFEVNMKLVVLVDRNIGIPDDFGRNNNSCLGIRGTDKYRL